MVGLVKCTVPEEKIGQVMYRRGQVAEDRIGQVIYSRGQDWFSDLQKRKGLVK